jgi:hypothetical protein
LCGLARCRTQLPNGTARATAAVDRFWLNVCHHLLLGSTGVGIVGFSTLVILLPMRGLGFVGRAPAENPCCTPACYRCIETCRTRRCRPLARAHAHVPARMRAWSASGRTWFVSVECHEVCMPTCVLSMCAYLSFARAMHPQAIIQTSYGARAEDGAIPQPQLFWALS